MDIREYSKNYYAATGVPVMVFDKNRYLEDIYGFTEDIRPSDYIIGCILSDSGDTGFYESDSNFIYGYVRCMDKSFILGPFSALPVNRNLVNLFMSENTLPPSSADDIRHILSSVPMFFVSRLDALLTLFCSGLAGCRDVSPVTTGKATDSSLSDKAVRDSVETSYEDKEDRMEHGTYYFESQMLSYVKDGNPAGLVTFLEENVKNTSFNEGVVADTPLRQAKNIFIANVARTGKDSAIPGGMDIEEAYYLIDSYSQQCERLTSITDINNLNYHMLVEFAERVARSKLPASISDETYGCIMYVNGHLNEPIDVQDVADSINRSVSYISKKFKKELGFSVGQYIIHARINEAKSLLLYSEKTLSEISTYLCFSSQPYFQNVFKQVTGQTPLEYRKKQRLLGWTFRVKSDERPENDILS